MLTKNKDLPNMCFSFREDAQPGQYVIAIKNGQPGYCRTSYDETDKEKAKLIVEYMNKKLGITALQQECMENGSLFGWGTPGANPEWLAESIKKREQEQCRLS